MEWGQQERRLFVHKIVMIMQIFSSLSRTGVVHPAMIGLVCRIAHSPGQGTIHWLTALVALAQVTWHATGMPCPTTH